MASIKHVFFCARGGKDCTEIRERVGGSCVSMHACFEMFGKWDAVGSMRWLFSQSISMFIHFQHQ